MSSFALTRKGSPLQRLALAVAARPQEALAWLLWLHVLLWWGVSMAAQANLPLDMIEQLAWGRDLQWVYHKHPPLPAWILGLVDWATAGLTPAIQLVAPVSVAVAFWAVWRLALEIVDPARAFIAVATLEAITFFTFQTPEFNHNVVQLPFWALTAWSLWRAMEQGRLLDWALAGLWAALAMLGKYFAGFLLISLVLFFLVEPRARRLLRTPGPWVTVAVGLAVLSPHLRALAELNFLPFDYALARAETADWLGERFGFPFEFIGTQLLAISTGLIALRLLYSGKSSPVLLPAAPPGDFAHRYVIAIGLLPCVLAAFASFVIGGRFLGLWGLPLWLFVGLVALALWPRNLTLSGMKRWLAAVTLFAVVHLGFYLGWIAYPVIGGEPERLHFPGPQLAEAATAAWQEQVPGRRLNYVAGDVWEAGNVAYYGPWRPSVVIDGNFKASYWITPRNLNGKGFLAVWMVRPGQPDQPTWLTRLLRQSKLELASLVTVTLPWQGLAAEWPPLTFRLAIVPPAGPAP